MNIKAVTKNLAIVLSSSAMAQAISLVFVPIITRIYGPEIYGYNSLFLSIVSMLVPIGALAYPLAIILCKSNTMMKGTASICITLSICICLILSTSLLLLKLIGVHFDSLEKLGIWVYALPFCLFFLTIMDIGRKVKIFNKKYKSIAVIDVSMALTNNLSKSILGYFQPSVHFLLGALNVTNFVFALIYFKKVEIMKFSRIKRGCFFLKKFNDFPKFRCPQMLLNAFIQNLPLIILSSYFGLASAAYFGVARSLLMAPVNLIGQSLNNVLYPQFSNLYNNKERLEKPLIITIVLLSLVSFLPLLIVFFYGDSIVNLVFGQDWIGAVPYIKSLSLLCFFIILSRPIINIIPVIKMQKEFLLIEVFGSAIKIGVLYYYALIIKDEVYTIISFSVVSCLVYIFLMFYTFLKLRKVYNE